MTGRHDTIEDGWHDVDIKLTDVQRDSFIEVFGKRYKPDTIRALKRFINYPKEFQVHGIYERVMFNKGGCFYVAGQDYPGEIALIRNLITK